MPVMPASPPHKQGPHVVRPKHAGAGIYAVPGLGSGALLLRAEDPFLQRSVPQALDFDGFAVAEGDHIGWGADSPPAVTWVRTTTSSPSATKRLGVVVKDCSASFAKNSVPSALPR